MVVPRALAIHPSMCRSAVSGAFGVERPGPSLTGRDCLVLYILLHRVLEEAGCSAENDRTLCAWLRHAPYVRILPHYVPTPLSFTVAELCLLQDTSLQSGANRRLRDTEVASARVRTWLESCLAERPHSFILVQALKRSDWLPLWRWADDMYGSRSFPERIAGYSGEVDEPVLVPGLDSFNHGRGAPVTWSYEGDQASGHTVLTLRTQVAPGMQVLNNYGAKSNEELLLSYGFVEPGGPDDVLVLRLHGPDAATHYWQRSSGSPPASLLAELRTTLGFGELPGPEPGPREKIQGLLTTARVLETLEQFLRLRRKRHRRADGMLAGIEPNVPIDGAADDETVRPEVLAAVREYRQGTLNLLRPVTHPQARQTCSTAQYNGHRVRWTRSSRSSKASALRTR